MYTYVHMLERWPKLSKVLHLSPFFSNLLFQSTVVLSTATTGRPSEISDFKCSVADLLSHG